MKVIGAIPKRGTEKFSSYLKSLCNCKPTKQDKINYKLFNFNYSNNG